MMALHESSAPSTPTHDAGTTSSAHVQLEIQAEGEENDVTLTDQTNLLPFRQVLAVFSGLALCIVVSTLDSVVVAASLPTISAAFDAGSISSWVPSAYLLTSTSFQPLYGRFSDIFGRKNVLTFAMSVFMLGNLVAGFSKSILQVIIFRGFAGAGGGGIISIAQIVISDIVSLRDRGKYQGIIGGAIALGYAIGPVIGGALSEKVSWRWCFWINAPISFMAICIVIFVLPLKPVQGDVWRKLRAIDYLGAGMVLSGCALIMLPLIWGGVTFPWKSATVLAPLFSGCVVIVLFCLWEWKGAKLPVVPMYIFKHATVTGVYITMFINGFVFFSSIYYLPQFFQVALGYTPIKAGVFLISLLASQTTSAWLAGVAVSRTGRYRTIIHAGFTLWAVADGCLSTITPKVHKAPLVISMLLAGVGAGMTLQTTTVAAQASVPRKDMSVVTAFRNFVRLLGGAFSLAICAAIINNSLKSSMHRLRIPDSTISSVIANPHILNNPAQADLLPSEASYILNYGYTRGIRSIFILNASLCATATLASITMIKHKDLTRRGSDAAAARVDVVEKAAEPALDPSRNRRHDVESGEGSVTPSGFKKTVQS